MICSADVTRIFLDCFLRKDEIEDKKPKEGIEVVYVEGVRQVKFGFHKERLKENTKDIEKYISELPSEFEEDGGHSFLALCHTKDDVLWTGDHVVCEQLTVLGIAIGRMKYTAPRHMWSILPGTMPYIEIIPKENEDA